MKVPRLSDLFDQAPRAMSKRARLYLATAGSRHFLVGASLLAAPWLYSAAAFIPIFNTLPLIAWGLIMTGIGIACYAAAGTRNPSIARVAIGVSACITLALAFGLTIGVVASWWVWIDRVSWPVVLDLIWTRPLVYPADLLGLGPAPPSPFLPIVMMAVAVKDFIVCRQPLRVPLEEWMPQHHRPGEA